MQSPRSLRGLLAEVRRGPGGQGKPAAIGAQFVALAFPLHPLRGSGAHRSRGDDNDWTQAALPSGGLRR